MCGIFGIAGLSTSFGARRLEGHVDCLFKLAASRGKDAAGVAFIGREGGVKVIKEPHAASRFIKNREYRALFEDFGDRIAIFGHSRLVTNGSLDDNENNQPVAAYDIVGIHNGIVTNDDELWNANPDLSRKHEVDSEALFALIAKYAKDSDGGMVGAVEKALNDIEGNASIAFFRGERELVIASNNGSLYFCRNDELRAFCFASERHMLRKFIDSRGLSGVFDQGAIQQLSPSSLFRIDLGEMRGEYSRLNRETASKKNAETGGNVRSRELASWAMSRSEEVKLARMEEEFDDSFARNLKRCTRCLLPSTFPFISFDDEGECNYCKRHKKPNLMGKDGLNEYLGKFRSGDGRKPDCIAAVSGGRDSIYGLHYLKKEMGMNPIAYTYDWGMVTDIARRNIARITGALGIEHVLVSADIRKKRAYVRMNLEAWLRRPSLGMVPILMAGDKKFKYYGMSLQKANNVSLAVYCAGNRFEKTDFKTGFCGVDEGETKGILTLSAMNTLKLLGYYGKEYISNPGYLNASMLDTAGAYYYSYVMPKDYIYLFHYIDWNEEEILHLLRNEYNWEQAEDTIATWRIGDGTACFYNYIYYRAAGFSEFDTFRSNQIREGHITRERALEVTLRENRPRFRAIKTYLDLLGMDFEGVLKVIDSIPRLYDEPLAGSAAR